MSRIFAIILMLIVSAPAFAGERYISNPRVEQIVRQETQRCPRCVAKHLLIRINTRSAKETQ